MKNIEEVLNNIKSIDGQADKLEDMISKAYDGYASSENHRIIVNREKVLDNAEAKAYSVQIENYDSPRIVAMVDEGLDHYVATVVDAYIEE